MNILRKTFGVGAVTLALLISVTTGAFGQGAGGGGVGTGTGSAAGTTGLVKLRANVVCVNCSLEEA